MVVPENRVHPAQIPGGIILTPECRGIGQSGCPAEFVFGHDEGDPVGAFPGERAAEPGDKRAGVAPRQQGQFPANRDELAIERPFGSLWGRKAHPATIPYEPPV